MYHDCKIQGNKGRTKQKASSLLTSFHNARWCCAPSWIINVILNHLTQLWTLQAIVLNGLLRHTHWYSSGTEFMGATNHFLIRFKSHTISWNPYQALLWGHKIVARQVIGPMGRSTMIPLNYHRINLMPNEILFINSNLLTLIRNISFCGLWQLT